MNEFLSEIYSQPKALKDTLNDIRENYDAIFGKVNEILKEREISKFIFSGMGSSYFSSYVPYYLLNQNGIHAEMREAGEFLLYSFPKTKAHALKDTCVVLISQSGESGEVVQVLKKLSSMNGPPIIVGVTNSPGSTLALKADITLLLRSGKEKSVTSKTYSCTLLFLYIFAMNLIEGKEFFSNKKKLFEIENLIEKVDSFLKDTEKIDIFFDNLLSFYGTQVDCLLILSRGPSLSTAYQGALNFKEIVKNYSEANPCSTFNHGCIECLNDNSKVIIISSDENNFKLNNHLLFNMLNKWKCEKILHITNRSLDSNVSPSNASPKVISFKHDISNPFLSPIFEIVILQLFFYKMAEKKGIVPGKFNFTQKITRNI